MAQQLGRELGREKEGTDDVTRRERGREEWKMGKVVGRKGGNNVFMNIFVFPCADCTLL
jgi:hypothetical protein